jgi:uncharacterized NAD(P)/FAD-binding protein YdhS
LTSNDIHATAHAAMTAHLDRVAREGVRHAGRRTWHGYITNMHHLDQLDQIAVTRDLADSLAGHLSLLVRDAHERGMTWAQIGDALGVPAEHAEHTYGTDEAGV